MSITVSINGRTFCPGASQDDFVSSMVISGERSIHVGLDSDEVVNQATLLEEVVDLQNRILLPEFVDGHVHIVSFGLALQKLDLLNCRSNHGIQKAITEYAAKNPSEPRILCQGWILSTNGRALASDLDHLDH